MAWVLRIVSEMVDSLLTGEESNVRAEALENYWADGDVFTKKHIITFLQPKNPIEFANWFDGIAFSSQVDFVALEMTLSDEFFAAVKSSQFTRLKGPVVRPKFDADGKFLCYEDL